MINFKLFRTGFRKVSFLFFWVIGFCSCDSYNYIDYNLHNSTSSSVKVTFNQWSFNDSMITTKDITFYLLPNEGRILTARGIIGTEIWNPEQGNDTIWMFPKLSINLKDTLPATYNLKSIKYWNYNGISRHHASLTLTLLDKYFQ